MKRKWILGAAILSLLAVAPAYAQEQGTEKPQETKPAQTQNEDHKPADTKAQPKQQTEARKEQQQAQKEQQASKDQQKQQEKTAKQQQQAQKQQEQAAKQQKDQEKVQKSVAKQQQQEEKQQKQQQQVAKQQEQQDNNQRQQTRSQQAENGQRGIHIPDDRFRAHFGREHHFHVDRQGGNRFVYGGYTFEFVDVWPVGWAYTDDCYIEYVDGEYYLFDLLHPGAQILVIVVA